MKKQKVLSLVLSLCMIVTLLPVTALAEGGGATQTITGFPGCAPQEVAVDQGTAREALGLPEALTATVETTADSGEAGSEDIELPVTWTGDYDGETPGVYPLTAAWDPAYAVGDDVAAPVVTVTVREKQDNALPRIVTGFPGFDGFLPLDTIEVKEKSTVEAIGLPGTIKAAVEGLEGDQDIPVTWETADGSDYETTEFETYDWSAVLGAGYKLDNGLDESSLPFITVNITGAANPHVKEAVYGAALNPDSYTFTPVTAGYQTAEVKQFTIRNNGDKITGLSASISEGTDYFEISAALSATELDHDTTATVSVRTKTGLSAGTHTGKLQINYTGGEISYSATADLSFTVHADDDNVDVSNESELEAALKETSDPKFTIKVAENANITLSQRTAMGSNHALVIPAGATVAITGGINVGDHTLTVNGGGTLICSRSNGHAIWGGQSGQLSLESVTVEITAGGISVSTVTVGSGGTIELKAPGVENLLTMFTLTVASGGAIDIQDFQSVGIDLKGTMTIKGSVKVGGGTGDNQGIRLFSSDATLALESGGSLEGNSGHGTGGVYLVHNSKVSGLSGKFSDRGTEFTASGEVTVGAADADASATGLSAGLYLWDSASSKFSKSSGTTTTYTVSFNANGGSGNMNNATGISGSYTLPACGFTAPDGKQFKGWATSADGAVLSNPYTVSADTTLYAIWEKVPAAALTIRASAATLSGGGLVTLTTSKTATVTCSGGVAVTGSGTSWSASLPNATATYTFTAAAEGGETATCTVSVSYYGGSSSGGGGGGGSGSGQDSSPPTVTPSAPDRTDTPTTAETKVDAKVDSSGKATVTVSSGAVDSAIKAAQDAAKKAGATENGIAVTINAETGKGAQSIAATLPEKSVDALIRVGVTQVTVKSDAATISLDLATLKQVQAAAGGAVTLSAQPVAVNTLSPAAQAAIGDRPVFRFSLISGGKAVSDFGGGSVSVALPYTLQAGEKAGNLVGVYVDDGGKVTYLTNSSYDGNTKALLFSTGHFSTFGIGYKADAPAFTDTTGHWAKDDIDFVAARGLLSGTSATTFSPNSGMTRGMFVTALGRLADIDPAQYQTSKFTDVAAGAYYAPYVNWAAAKGVVSGTTATTFAPDQLITRQQMAVIMANYAKAMGYTVPKTREAVIFTDKANIASWAADAVKAMQMAGVLMGKEGNRFDPTATATRAEAAAVLHRYVELVIDPATAQGLDVNDSGKAMMYEDGKLVKSASRSVNGVTYSFNANGEAALFPNKKSGVYTVQKGDSFWLIAHKLNCTMAELEQLNNKSRYALIHPGDVLIVPQV